VGISHPTGREEMLVREMTKKKKFAYVVVSVLVLAIFYHWLFFAVMAAWMPKGAPRWFVMLSLGLPTHREIKQMPLDKQVFWGPVPNLPHGWGYETWTYYRFGRIYDVWFSGTNEGTPVEDWRVVGTRSDPKNAVF